MSQRHPNGSETQEGPDWWLASDNRWYPPELHPEFRNARSVVIGDAVVGDGADTDAHPDEADTQPPVSDGPAEAIPGLLGIDQDPAPTESDPTESAPGAGAAAGTGQIFGLEATSGDDQTEPDQQPIAEQHGPAEQHGAAEQHGSAEHGSAEQHGAVEHGPAEHGSAEQAGAGGERPPISIGGPTGNEASSMIPGSAADPATDAGIPESTIPESTMPDSATAPTELPAENANAVVNPWTLPVRGRSDPDSSLPAASADTNSGHRIVLPGEFDTQSPPQSRRPSGPTPVSKSITFRPAEPTTVQAAVTVPVADDETPWYKRSPDGTEPAVVEGKNTPNIYGGSLSVAAGALAIVGALMTWATETGPLLDGFLWARKVPGFASNGGWVLVCGLLMGVAGVLSIIGIKPTGIWSIMSVVSGGLVLAAVLYSYADIVGSASEDWRNFVAASTGIDAVTLQARGVGLRPAFGLWLSAIAGLLGCAAGIYFKRDF